MTSVLSKNLPSPNACAVTMAGLARRAKAARNRRDESMQDSADRFALHPARMPVARARGAQALRFVGAVISGFCAATPACLAGPSTESAYHDKGCPRPGYRLNVRPPR